MNEGFVRRAPTLLILLALLSTTGCVFQPSQSLITSMEDISTDYERSGFIFKQYKIVSISSQLLIPEVGLVYHMNPSKGLSTAIGIGDTHSCYMTFTVDNPAVTTNLLVDIRKDLVDLYVLAAEAMLRKVEHLRARGEREDFEDKPKKPSDTQTIMSLIGKKKFEAEANAETRYIEAREEFNDRYRELVSKINDTGVYVFRWTTYDRSSKGLSLGAIFSGFGRDEILFNGFALVGGLRTSMLVVGEDIVPFVDSGLPLNPRWKKKAMVSTFTVQVRHLLYVSGAEIERELSAKLKASAQQLRNAGKTLQELDKVELEYYVRSLSNLFNIGISGGMKKERHRISWNEVMASGDNDVHLSEAQGWQPVLTTVTRLDSLRKMFR